MNTEFLKIFVTVAETRNFSLTAKLTNRSQSSVSQAIKSLETDLGFRLFYRDNKEVVLTSSGEIFYSRIRVLLNNLDSIINESKNLGSTFRTIIRVGIAGTPFENRVLPELLSKFQQNEPGINLEVEYLNYNLLKQHLINRECDLIFSSKDNLERMKGVEFQQLLKGEFVAVVPCSKAISQQAELKLADLHDNHLYLMSKSWSSPLQNKLNYNIVNEVSGISTTIVNVTSAADFMTKAQLGIEITNSVVCDLDYENCRIIPLRDTDEVVYGIAKLKSYRSPLVNKFLDAISQSFTELNISN